MDFPLWSGSFFALLLLSIAVMPLVAPAFWSRHYGLVSIAFAIPAGLFVVSREAILLVHVLTEYVSFIILIGSLFVVSGGIVIRIGAAATPRVNTLILAVGALLASLIGTTGASMVLIRPLLKINRWRRNVRHLCIFFIFLVSNCGGLLTPLGDPPLFLGFLRGVPFVWTLQLIPEWATVCGILLAVFYVMERRAHARENQDDFARSLDELPERPLEIRGRRNFFLLALIIAAFFVPPLLREALMVAAALLSVRITPGALREENAFTYHPIKEVALLFVGIFVTMVPVLEMLKLHGSQLGITEPWHFFWVTGALSSFLDNAPTYLVFMATGQSVAETLKIAGPAVCGVPVLHLKAISCGAVMMGANTYIGNGPNFMVKAICEENGIEMPSFFGYMLWSGLVLLPSFGLVTLLFFR